MSISDEINTLVNLAWDSTIDDDTRDSMTSHFICMCDNNWDRIKYSITYSDSVRRVIDTIDILREMR